MNENELRDLLPADRSLPASRRRDMKERLMVQIEQEEKSTRNHFRLVVGAAAAALVVVAGAAAVIAGGDDGKETIETPAAVTDRAVPDPGEAARVEAKGVQRNIDMDVIACTLNTIATGPDTEDLPWQGVALDVPLEEPLTVSMFTEACTREYLAGASPVYSPVACVGDGKEFPKVVVGLASETCDEVMTQSGYTVRALGEADLAEVNHLRAVEIAMLAVPQECATADQTAAWAAEVLDQEGLVLDVQIDDDPAPEPGGGSNASECPFQTWVNWEESRLIVQRPSA